MQTLHVIDEWNNCYKKGWKNLIVPEVFQHPAKYSRALIERIYRHVLDEGWIHEGQIVIDPFAGAGLGAFDAMRHGLHFIGVELEPRFVELADETYACPGFDAAFWRRYQGRAEYIGLLHEYRALCPCCETVLAPSPKRDKRTGKLVEQRIPSQPAHVYRGNIPMWTHRYAGRFARWGSARVLQGDSRRLREVLAERGIALSVMSPAYAGSLETAGGIDPEQSQHIGGPNSQMNRSDTRYGRSPGQLGALPPGQPPTLAVSSPPFRQSSGGVARDDGSRPGDAKGDVINTALRKRHAACNAAAQAYGESDANLANMAEGRAPIVITSPVYLDARQDTTVPPGAQNIRYGTSPAQLANLPEGAPPVIAVSSLPFETVTSDKPSQSIMASGLKMGASSSGNGYGDTLGNIGNDSGETFWTASAQIISQLHAALEDGAHAVFVTKAYIRDGKLVDFPGQWAALCESCGFRLLHVHRALLRDERGKQLGMDGNHKDYSVTCMSFFRQLDTTRKKAAQFWPTLTRAEQAAALAQAHVIEWAKFRQPANGKRPKPPKRKKIITRAHLLAYSAAGKPDVAIETEIDAEIVLCMERV